MRPNGSRAWVREEDVTVEEDDWRIEVHLADHQLVVFNGPEVWMAEPIAVGREPTPTPGGTFYLIELLQPPDPDGAYGPLRLRPVRLLRRPDQLQRRRRAPGPARHQ